MADTTTSNNTSNTESKVKTSAPSTSGINYTGVASGATQLASQVIEGLNPMGNYNSTRFQYSNDPDALYQQAFNTSNVYNKYNTAGTIAGMAGTGAGIGTAIMPGIGTAIGAVGGALIGGITSVFGAKSMERRTESANAKTAGQFDFVNKQQQSNTLFNAKLNPMNYAANGGQFPLMEVNTGGLHSSNPYGGVPFSSTGGVINSAEEGETITKVGNTNRVYSDRFKLTKSVINQTGLDKNLVGKTPAEASKIINRKFVADKVAGKDEILPMDQIRRNGLLPKLDDIFMAQEILKDGKSTKNNSNELAMGGTVLRNTRNRLVVLDNIVNPFAKGGSIHIDPSKKGTFTAAATKHGKSVQAFASQVLANKENYSPAMVKKANFARNAASWKHGDGDIVKVDASKIKDKTKLIAPKSTFDLAKDYQTRYGEIHVPKNSSDLSYSDYLKYAPVLGNLGQMISLAGEKPEVVNYDKVSLPTKGQKAQMRYIDTRPIIQQVNQAQRSTASQLREASAGNRTQYMTNVAGSDLQYADRLGNIQMQADEANWQRYLNVLSMNNAMDAQYNQQLLQAQQLNAGLSFQEKDVNARNRAALSNLRSQASQSLFSNLGAIGQEQENANIISTFWGINPKTGKKIK